jgi:hypothetical protein
LSKLTKHVLRRDLAAPQRGIIGEGSETGNYFAAVAFDAVQALLSFRIAHPAPYMILQGPRSLAGEVIKASIQDGPLGHIDGRAATITHLFSQLFEEIARIAEEALDICPDRFVNPSTFDEPALAPSYLWVA